MRLVESHLESKSGSPDGGEDVVVVTDAFVAVIDGTTSTHGGLASGLHASRLVAAAIRELPADVDATACISDLTLALSRAGVEGTAEHRFSAVTAVFSKARREIWRVGDVHVAIDGVARGAQKRIDESAAAARAAVLACLLREGATVEELRGTDPGRQMILPLLRRQHLFRNLAEPHPLAYGAIDGRAVPQHLVDVIAVRPSQAVVLASDGYPLALPTLAETEDYLRRDLEEDPLRIHRHPTTKGVLPGNASFDDRAYVRLAV